MALADLMFDIGARMIVSFVFVVVNSLVLREIAVVLFKLKEKNMFTALYVSIWLTAAVFLFSFFNVMTWVNLLFVVLASLLFMFLVKFYYKTNFRVSFLIWLVWFAVYIILGMIVILISGLV